MTKKMNIRNRMNIRILCWERKSKHGVDFIQAEYKLKKERWKREMDNQDTPKSQRNQGTHEGKKEKKTNNSLVNYGPIIKVKNITK